jgi:hypothetical protein
MASTQEIVEPSEIKETEKEEGEIVQEEEKEVEEVVVTKRSKIGDDRSEVTATAPQDVAEKSTVPASQDKLRELWAVASHPSEDDLKKVRRFS